MRMGKINESIFVSEVGLEFKLNPDVWRNVVVRILEMERWNEVVCKQ